jgi:hypothetical protein
VCLVHFAGGVTRRNVEGCRSQGILARRQHAHQRRLYATRWHVPLDELVSAKHLAVASGVVCCTTSNSAEITRERQRNATRRACLYRVCSRSSSPPAMLRRMPDGQLVQWREWCEGPIRNHVLNMHAHRHVWQQLQQIISENPNVPASY